MAVPLKITWPVLFKIVTRLSAIQLPPITMAFVALDKRAQPTDISQSSNLNARSYPVEPPDSTVRGLRRRKSRPCAGFVVCGR